MCAIFPSSSSYHIPPSPPFSFAVVRNRAQISNTTFQPFRNNPLNPSYLIASSLPSSIPFPAPSGAKATADNQSPISTLPPRKIHIHTHPSPLRVSYSTVRNTVPAILNSYAQTHDGKRPDIIVHIGLASSRSFYSVETVAHRDGYCMADVDGRVGFEDGEKRWKEHSFPAILSAGPATDTKHDGNDNNTFLPLNPTTMEKATARATTETGAGEPSSFSTTISQPPTPPPAAAAATTSQPINPYPPDLTFLENWKSLSPSSANVRLSNDAGRYLCEFIFYTSLAQALGEGQPQNVVFLHVPGPTDDENLEKGRDVTIALVKSLVSCWVDGG